MDSATTVKNISSKNNFIPNLEVKRLDKEEGHFTQISNKTLGGDLTNKTLGLHVRLLSLPPDWHLNMTDLPRRCNCSLKTVNTGLKELIKNGYLKKVSYIDESTGRFLKTDYLLSEAPDFLEENKVLIESNEKQRLEDLKKGIFPKRKSFTHYIKVVAQSIINRISYPVDQKGLMVKGLTLKGLTLKGSTTNTYSTKKENINTSSYKEGKLKQKIDRLNNSVGNIYNQTHKEEILKNIQEQSLNLAVVKNDDDDSLKVFKVQEELFVKSEVVTSVENMELRSIAENISGNQVKSLEEDKNTKLDNENKDLIDLFNSIAYNEKQSLELIKNNSREFILQGFEKLKYEKITKTKAGWLYRYFKNPENYVFSDKDLKLNKESQDQDDFYKLCELFETDKKDGEAGIAEKLSSMISSWRSAAQGKLFQESAKILCKIDDLVTAAKKYKVFESILRFVGDDTRDMIGGF